MGRYVRSGARVGIPDSGEVTVCGQVYPRTNVSYFQYQCKINECWPNRVLVDTPGSYTFTVPTGATCARAIVVGGGGKFGCKPNVCCIYGGAGGAYAEKIFPVTAGTSMTVVVGAQQANSSITYATSSVSMTAGGATFCTPGTATGGDWNSTGGCAGLAGAYCACGTCCGQSAVTCCGYCIVIGCMFGYSDSGIYQCCALFLPGGGSAGSFVATTGGAGGWVCDTTNGYSASGAAGGGGGIGVLSRCVYYGANCNCNCWNGYARSRPSYWPGSAQGGGGTSWHPCLFDTCRQYSWDSGCCIWPWWAGGIGHKGGLDKQEGLSEFYYATQVNCCNCYFTSCYVQEVGAPKTYPWHDIFDINGSGSPGKNINTEAKTMESSGYGCHGGWGDFDFDGSIYQRSGEGAGTGGHYYSRCDPGYFGLYQLPFFIDWTTICCLGTTSRCCDALKMRHKWMPHFISCAGTLGGSGGVNICGMASKAGYGGGAGGFKRFIYCVCYGGAYDCCNQAANTPLAFPPSCLDQLVSNAGTGLAIIYWR